MDGRGGRGVRGRGKRGGSVSSGKSGEGCEVGGGGGRVDGQLLRSVIGKEWRKGVLCWGLRKAERKSIILF